MHPILLAACALMMIQTAAADEFPGSKVKNVAPFNSAQAIVMSGTTCPISYTSQEFSMNRAKVVTDIVACVRNDLGIKKDLGLDFGVGKFSDCVVPDTYDTKSSSNNPVWPVCCGVEDDKHNYRFICQLYATPH